MLRRGWALLCVLIAGSSSAADGFYTWTGPVPAQPGVLLRSEALTVQQRLAEAAQNLRILYSSTDGLDNRTPIIVSG
ncbi:alpha/beta hydrolase, partial [Pseudomonas tolaasii]|nr:alpha/beta hydrolase [Pseudomonas tolaasii]